MTEPLPPQPYAFSAITATKTAEYAGAFRGDSGEVWRGTITETRSKNARARANIPTPRGCLRRGAVVAIVPLRRSKTVLREPTPGKWRAGTGQRVRRNSPPPEPPDSGRQDGGGEDRGNGLPAPRSRGSCQTAGGWVWRRGERPGPRRGRNGSGERFLPGVDTRRTCEGRRRRGRFRGEGVAGGVSLSRRGKNNGRPSRGARQPSGRDG